MSSENEYSICNDVNESISDDNDNDNSNNLNEKSLITKCDKIVLDESSYYKVFEDMIDSIFLLNFQKLMIMKKIIKKRKAKFKYTK